MDKTEKPTLKQPTFPDTQPESRQGPSVVDLNEEHDTDALFAGLFGESIQDPHIVPQASPSSGQQNDGSEAFPQKQWPPPENQHNTNVSERSEHNVSDLPLQGDLLLPTSRVVSSRQDSNDTSLQDLVAVLEQNISRLREERVALSVETGPTTFSQGTSARPSTSTPSKAGGLLSLLDEEDRSLSKAFAQNPDQPHPTPNFGEFEKTTLSAPPRVENKTPRPERNSFTNHPDAFQTVSSTKTSFNEKNKSQITLKEQAKQLQDVLLECSHQKLDASWKRSQKLFDFLDTKGLAVQKIPISQNLFVWPTWSWLWFMALCALCVPFFGVWAQAGATLGLGFWLLEHGLGWPISDLLLPKRANTLLYLAPPRPSSNASATNGAMGPLDVGQPQKAKETLEPTEKTEEAEVVLAIPYQGGQIEPALPRAWLRKLPNSWRLLEHIGSPKVWGGMGIGLWFLVISAPSMNRAMMIVLCLAALLFVAILGSLTWSFYQTPQTCSSAWNLAFSLQLYEQATAPDLAYRLHLVWFDASDASSIGERLLQEEILPTHLKNALWLGILPFSPTEKDFVLIESESYLRTLKMHPHITQVLSEESAASPKRYRLKTRLWTWPLRIQKRPLLLFGGEETLGFKEPESAENTRDLSEEESLFQIVGSLGKKDKENHRETEPSNALDGREQADNEKYSSIKDKKENDALESNERGQEDDVISEISLRLQDFILSFLGSWRTRRLRLPWLSIAFGLFGSGWWVCPCEASDLCQGAYQRQISRCDGDYTQRMIDCSHNDAIKRGCVQQEKQGITRCKALFDRVKSECALRSLRQEQQANCKQAAESARRGCQAPTQLKAFCTQSTGRCNAVCGKTDHACEERCQEQQVACLRAAEDQWVRCQRKARDVGQKCRRKAQDEEILRVYRCLQESVKARIRCQRSKRDERVLCEDGLEDRTRKCRRMRWDERKRCYDAALQKRLTCRD